MRHLQHVCTAVCNSRRCERTPLTACCSLHCVSACRLWPGLRTFPCRSAVSDMVSEVFNFPHFAEWVGGHSTVQDLYTIS